MREREREREREKRKNTASNHKTTKSTSKTLTTALEQSVLKHTFVPGIQSIFLAPNRHPRFKYCKKMKKKKWCFVRTEALSLTQSVKHHSKRVSEIKSLWWNNNEVVAKHIAIFWSNKNVNHGLCIIKCDVLPGLPATWISNRCVDRR